MALFQPGCLRTACHHERCSQCLDGSSWPTTTPAQTIVIDILHPAQVTVPTREIQGKLAKTDKSTPDVIFVFGFSTHSGALQDNWLQHNLQFFGLGKTIKWTPPWFARHGLYEKKKISRKRWTFTLKQKEESQGHSQCWHLQQAGTILQWLHRVSWRGLAN